MSRENIRADQSQASAAMPLQITQLQKSLGHARVLREVTLALQPGDIVGLLGGNGAGKSTLIKTAIGLLQPDAGQAQLFGEDSISLTDATKAKLAYVPQDVNLFGWLSGAQLLAFMKGLYPHWNHADASSLATRWKVPLHTPIASLSAGLQQRLQIVRALATQAELLVLDEPVGSLDPAGRRQFLSELLGRCAERQTTVLFSTHIVSDLERCANKVAILHQGKILLCAELDILKQSMFRVEIPRVSADALMGVPGVLNVRHLSVSRAAVCLLVEDEEGTSPAAQGALNQHAFWRAKLGVAVLNPLGLEDLMVELGS